MLPKDLESKSESVKSSKAKDVVPVTNNKPEYVSKSEEVSKPKDILTFLQENLSKMEKIDVTGHESITRNQRETIVK